MRATSMKVVVVVVAVLVFAGCGGGGGGGGNNATTSTPKAWGAAQLIEADDTGSAQSPKVAVAPNGNALAVWQQSDGLRNNIWANRYTAGSGWGMAELIEAGDGDAIFSQVALDPNGNALAVWQQSDGLRNNIWANRYTAGVGWGMAELIEADDAGSVFTPQIAVDPNGNALAVWRQSDGTRFNIWANRFSAATNAWGMAELIEADDVGDAIRPQMAVDPNGNVVAVWQQSDGLRNNIWANRYTVGSVWGTAELIEAGDGDAIFPQIAVDPNGNALAVWQQSDGTRNNIWANRHSAATNTWGMAELIETDDAGAGFPQIGVDPNGNAIAVWEQRGSIQANRYTAGVGWGMAELIDAGDFGAGFPQIAFDPNGNALAVWQQSDGARFNIWANRYSAATNTWDVAELIETDDAGDAFSPQIAFDPNGNAIAVWQQSDGTRFNIWANRFD